MGEEKACRMELAHGVGLERTWHYPLSDQTDVSNPLWT